jgi:hypothetical protein
MSQHDYEYLLTTLYMLFVLQEDGVMKEGCGSSLPLGEVCQGLDLL